MPRFRSTAVAACVGLMSMGLLGAAPLAMTAAGVDDARLKAADQAGNAGQWMSYSRTYDEQRYSPLKQINAGNVGKLGLAWYAELNTARGMESTPLYIDGVLYNVEPWNVTTAYDARTGKVLWTYDPKVDHQTAALACCDIDSRGVAAWKGKIYVAALDGRMIALDAKTGKPVWTVQTLEKGWPYTVTGAPRVYDGKVIIGNGGAEGAARGYMTAYDAETGKQLWRFYIVPGNPANGFKDPAMAMAAKTWGGKWWEYGGGGGDWDTMAYDPKLRLVYIGAGNGGPWAQQFRGGRDYDNLFTSSVVALNVDTGKYVWHYQETPGDEWDYDSTQPIVLADMKIDGRQRQVLLHAPKNGYFYVMDRKTGELLSAKPYVPITWSTGFDMKTKRPIETANARFGEELVQLGPGPSGGHNWTPMAYSPDTGLAYFAVTESYFAYGVDPKFTPEYGKMHQLGIAVTGQEDKRKAMNTFAAAHNGAWLTAWDPARQQEAWRVPYKRRGSGGVLATAGNLVFQGTINETLAAYRADTGAKVWDMPVQQVPIASPITYELDGVQYIAINAGWGGGLAHGGVVNNDSDLHLSEHARLMVFKLGADTKLPPLPPKTDDDQLTQPPVIYAVPAVLERGKALYAKTCSGCHGVDVQGGVKDLRRASVQTHKEFLDIVLGGKRADKGMVSFASVLSKDDAEAIHQYIYSQIDHDWEDLRAGK